MGSIESTPRHSNAERQAAKEVKLGFLALRAAQADSFERMTESFKQARSLTTALGYVGCWAINKAGLRPLDIYSRRYLRDGFRLIGGGYQALVLTGSAQPDEVVKVFYRSLLYPDEEKETEYGELLRDRGLLIEHFGERAIKTEIRMESPPLRVESPSALPTAVQPKIEDVVTTLTAELKRPSLNLAGETRLTLDLREMLTGLYEIHRKTGTAPDMFTEGNTLIHDDGTALRATQVDNSFGSRKWLKESVTLTMKKAQELKSLVG